MKYLSTWCLVKFAYCSESGAVHQAMHFEEGTRWLAGSMAALQRMDDICTEKIRIVYINVSNNTKYSLITSKLLQRMWAQSWQWYLITILPQMLPSPMHLNGQTVLTRRLGGMCLWFSNANWRQRLYVVLVPPLSSMMTIWRLFSPSTLTEKYSHTKVCEKGTRWDAVRGKS